LGALTAELRQCRHCLETKPLSGFRPVRGKYFWKCSACVDATNSRWIERNRDAVRTIKKRYCENHPDSNAEAKRRYAEKTQEKRAEWKRDNRGRVNQRARERYAEAPEAFKARIEKYASKYPEKVALFKRCAAQVGRARRIAAEGKCTTADIQAIMARQRSRCANRACLASIKVSYHIDHVMPIVKGGSNWPENIQLLCPSCNLRKSAKDPYEWAALNGALFCL